MFFGFPQTIKIGGKPQGQGFERATFPKPTKKAPAAYAEGALKNTGNTYFRTGSTIIGSESLTTVFGMGTGVTFPIWSPEETERAVRPDRPVWLDCVVAASMFLECLVASRGKTGLLSKIVFESIE